MPYGSKYLLKRSVWLYGVLVGGAITILTNMSSSVRMIIPNKWKINENNKKNKNKPPTRCLYGNIVLYYMSI